MSGLERFVSGERASYADAMAQLDKYAIGFLVIVDGTGALVGTVTDGDLRRRLLAGDGLDAPVARAMNRNPITVAHGLTDAAMKAIMLDRDIRHLPIVDETNRLLRVVQLKEVVRVPLSSPDITDVEIGAVLQVLKSPNLSLGPKLVEFEKQAAAVASRRHAIAVNSGTSGLHLVVRAAGLGSGDEVITTPFSFIASSNALLYEDVTPVFVDIDPVTFNIDPDRVEAAITPRTKAILAVDVFGQPAAYDRLQAIADRHGLFVISDCCESIGSAYGGRPAGSFGLAGVFAFYPNKQTTTGEGGVIVTDDDDIARLCRSMRNQGRGEGDAWLAHERLGYNYRLPELACALGLEQLKRLSEIVRHRAAVAESYNRVLSGAEWIRLPRVAPQVTVMSWFVYVVLLDESFTQADRDAILVTLRGDGIGASNYFPPIHLQPFYRARFGYAPGTFRVTESISARTIALPFHNHLSQADVDVVARRLDSAVRQTVRLRQLQV